MAHNNGFLIRPMACDKPRAPVPALAQDRRKYFRAFPRFALTVKVRVQYSSGLEPVELTGTTVDIGLGGLGATLSAPLLSKERVWLQFIVPERLSLCASSPNYAISTTGI